MLSNYCQPNGGRRATHHAALPHPYLQSRDQGSLVSCMQLFTVIPLKCTLSYISMWLCSGLLKPCRKIPVFRYKVTLPLEPLLSNPSSRTTPLEPLLSNPSSRTSPPEPLLSCRRPPLNHLLSAVCAPA